jgi:hypothetical protein
MKQKLIPIIIKEIGIIEQNVQFRVDEFGFFLYWQADGKVIIEFICNLRILKFFFFQKGCSINRANSSL